MKGIPAFACLLAALPLAQPARSPAVAGDVLVPTSVQENFQHDLLGQFASYPPAQDVGYEPSLAPTTGWDAPDGRALMRVVRPGAAGPLRIGFIRQVALAAAPDATVAFKYRIEPAAARASIEVGVAGRDGVRYVARADAVPGAWRSIDLPLSALVSEQRTSMPDETGFEAVFFIADVPQANPDTTYRFLIDDVQVRAQAPAEFDMSRPAARRVAAGAALTAERGVSRGESIAIDAVAPVPLANVTVSLRRPDGGQAVQRTLVTTDQGRRWTDSRVYAVGQDDPRGVWRAVLEGRTSDGRTMQTEVRFLVTDAGAQPHPRIYFAASGRDALRARTTHARMAPLWRKIADAAKASRASGPIAHGGAVFERLGREHLLPTLLGYFDVVNRARARIYNNALVAWVEGDEEAFEAARTAMLEVSAWSRWEPPWFTAQGQQTYYPAGLLASAVALGYDLLHDRLTEEERGVIRRALLERAILPTWREYVVDNRVMANTSNWISHTVGGAILAATAIIGDGTPEERAALHLPLNGLLMKIEAHMAASFLPDGSYGEGISYLEFDLETLGPMLHATERALGHSYWDSTHVLASLRYPLHTLAQPPSESLDMGDTHPPAGHGIGPVVYRSEDPEIRWYGQRFDPRTIYDFIFFNERVDARRPQGFGSRLFDVKGNAVFRTGWDGDDAILLFRAGPTFNHNHNDQGSFLLRNFDELLVTEAGWSDYYKDPYYGTFFTQAIGHNTLLVNGHPESQVIADTPQFAALDRYPRITGYVSSRFYDGVGSQLESVYPQLSDYTRQLAFLKPDLLVVFDRVRAAEPARYNVLFHVADMARAAAGKNAGRYEGARASLAWRAFSSHPLDAAVRPGHIPYPVLAARTPPEVPPQPGYFDIATTEAASETWVLSLLAMRPRAADAQTLAAAWTAVNRDGWVGLQAARDGATELVLFRNGAGRELRAFDGWQTDAAALVIRSAAASTRVGAQELTRIAGPAGAILGAGGTVDAALDLTPSSIDARLRANRPTAVSITLPRAPARVLVNGREAGAGDWQYVSGEVRLQVPAGESHVVIAVSGAEEAR